MKKGYECMNHNQIKSIVYNLIKKYETRNPVRLAKELDIIIQIGDLKKNIWLLFKDSRKRFYLHKRKIIRQRKKVSRSLSS